MNKQLFPEKALRIKKKYISLHPLNGNKGLIR